MVDAWVARFLRWSGIFLLLGLAAGFVPVGHYLMMGSDPQCSWAPVHGHLILLGWLGMTAFGLTYRALFGDGGAPFPERSVRWHYICCVAGVLGVLAHGLIGWFVLAHLEGRFPAATLDRFWFGGDAVFLTLYGVGCIFFWVTIRRPLSLARG